MWSYTTSCTFDIIPVGAHPESAAYVEADAFDARLPGAKANKLAVKRCDSQPGQRRPLASSQAAR